MAAEQPVVRCICYYCGAPHETFVKIPLTQAERKNNNVHFLCAFCAMHLQRGGEPVGASRVLHYYLTSTRALLSKVLTFHNMAIQNARRDGEVNARRRHQNIEEIEPLRERMETLHHSLCGMFRVNGLPIPNPSWPRRYSKRARDLGFPSTLYPTDTPFPQEETTDSGSTA